MDSSLNYENENTDFVRFTVTLFAPGVRKIRYRDSRIHVIMCLYLIDFDEIYDKIMVNEA